MGTQLPPEKRAHTPHSIFGPCLLWPNGWMDEDATWYGSRPWHRPHCIRRGPSCLRNGHNSPPLFSPMSIVATVAHLSYCWALVFEYRDIASPFNFTQYTTLPHNIEIIVWPQITVMSLRPMYAAHLLYSMKEQDRQILQTVWYFAHFISKWDNNCHCLQRVKFEGLKFLCWFCVSQLTKFVLIFLCCMCIFCV